MNNKYQFAARLTTEMVVEILATRNNWSINKTLSVFSKLHLFETLQDTTTEFWIDNPNDIADLCEKELNGLPILAGDFFK